MSRSNLQSLERAIAAAGGNSALARAIRVSPQAISQWREIPIKRLKAVEKATGIRREDLRPDLYE